MTTTDRLVKNYLGARKSWESWCFLDNFNLDIPNPDIRIKVDNNPLLFHVRYLSIKDFYVEMYKVVRETKKDRDDIFYHLSARLNRPDTNQKSINEAIDLLNSQRQAIDEICKVRDKYYAHLDMDYQIVLNSPNFPTKNFLSLFQSVEKGIMLLTGKKYLVDALSMIYSRNDFKL